MHRLQMQRVFVPWGSKAVALPTMAPRAPPPGEEALPPGVEPLQLWPFEDSGAPEDAKPILVDNMLVKWLRPHQRLGCVLSEARRRTLLTCRAWRVAYQGAVHV